MFSTLCLTVLVSASILAAVCSSEAAYSSVRSERSILPAAICRVAEAIASLPVRTSATMADKLSFMRFKASSNGLVSSRLPSSKQELKSPTATV